MIVQGIKKGLKFISTRSIGLYLIGALLTFVVVDMSIASFHSRLYVLSRLMPALQPIVDHEKYNKPLSENKLKDYYSYFKTVTHYMPETPNAYIILGYTAFYLDKYDEAVEAFEKSAKISPHFFYTHFNLGLVHFHNKDYEKARKAFEVALAQSPRSSIKIMDASVVYIQLLVHDDDPIHSIPKSLNRNYNICNALYEMTGVYLKTGQMPPTHVLFNEDDLRLQFL